MSIALDSIFGSLSDPTRRDIIARVSIAEMSVSEIAEPYDMSLAAISKHLKILERAKLIVKIRRGKQLFVRLSPAALRNASTYLDSYRKMWEDRFDALEEFLAKGK